ncbi:hypothetical protein TNCV_1979391 [Trichonephila clavipes]|nr:hypothetical protein TNCV_1979391 [Trichonephila clavipes]
MIKITAFCDKWMMTKSVVSVAAIVGYNRSHTPRHKIKEALEVSLGYSSLDAVSIYCQKLIWCSSVWLSRASCCANMDYTVLIGDRSGELAGQRSNSI